MDGDWPGGDGFTLNELNHLREVQRLMGMTVTVTHHVNEAALPSLREVVWLQRQREATEAAQRAIEAAQRAPCV